MIENINWYKFSQIEDQIFLDASIKDWIAPGLLAALLAVMTGSAMWNASQKYNISEIELGKALKNPQIRQQVEYYVSQQNNQTAQEDQAEKIFNMNEKQQNQPKQHNNKQTQLKSLTKEEISAIDILARTLWGEAKGESYEGQLAVASTIWNRANANPKRLVPVAKVYHQYSVWNDGKEERGHGEGWEKIKKLAEQMVRGTFKPTVSYESYFNPSKVKPSWAYYGTKLVTPNKKIGNHIFLNPKQVHNYSPRTKKSK